MHENITFYEPSMTMFPIQCHIYTIFYISQVVQAIIEPDKYKTNTKANGYFWKLGS